MNDNSKLLHQLTLVCVGLLGVYPALCAAAAPGSPPTAPAPQAATSAASSAFAPLTSRSWTTTGPLIQPTTDERHPVVAVKDPSVVFHNGRWHIFATTAGSKGWGMAYLNFTDWDQAAKAKLVHLDDNPHLRGYNCAPQVFYFRPHKKWYLIFQSQQPRFSTTNEIADPMSWSAPRNFFEGTPKSVVEGWLDYWIICNDTHAYLFFPDDHGRIYRSRTRIEDFPRGFDEPVVIMKEAKNDLFEGICVYRIKGTNQLLLLVECIGKHGSRYYRAFTTDRLDGQWKPLLGADTEATPFAGSASISPWAPTARTGPATASCTGRRIRGGPGRSCRCPSGWRPTGTGVPSANA